MKKGDKTLKVFFSTVFGGMFGLLFWLNIAETPLSTSIPSFGFS